MNDVHDDQVDRDDLRLAMALAEQAGTVLLDLRAVARRQGWDTATTKDRGDQDSNQLLLAELARWRPDDAVLTEEGADSEARLSASRVWVIDPLDGTREFSEFDRDDWAVHVALCIDGRPAIGVVVLPARGEITSGLDAVLPPFQIEAPRILVSRTRPPQQAEVVAEALGGTLVPMGSAGAKTCAILRGDADLYVHAGGQYEWDLAAPAGVALAAGLHATWIDGSPLLFNRPNPYLPDVLLGDIGLARRALEALQALASG